MSAESWAILLAGCLWPFIFQAIKGAKLTDRLAQAVAVVCCYLFALAAHILSTGDFTLHGVGSAMAVNGSQIALLALVIYRQVIKGNPTLEDLLATIAGRSPAK